MPSGRRACPWKGTVQDLGREAQKIAGEAGESILAMETAQAEIMGRRVWAAVEP